MALASRPRNSLNDENSHPTGKVQASGVQGTAVRSGLKQQRQQSITSERRILSDISNTKSSLSSLGTPKPSPKPGLAVFRSENLPPKAAAGQPPQSSSQKPQARIPLRNIVNESQLAPSIQNGAKPIPKKKPGFKIRLTPEQLRQAEEWAKEDLPIEQTHFTGQEMDALREKAMEAEIEETVAMVRNYSPACCPPSRKPTIDDKTEESIYFEDGRLKPDLRCNSFDEDTDQPMDIEPLAEDDPLLTTHTSSVDDFQYPCIPENWHVVRDDCPTASG